MSQTQTSSRLAFAFPGQGSQSVGMVAALAGEFGEVKARYEAASEVLGFDLFKLVNDGPEDELNRTQNTQPALLAASVATWDIWLKEGGALPTVIAGHSFGEYSALVCAGALEFATAVGLVAERGRLMQQAVPPGEGAMAAILGLDLEPLQAACAEAAAEGGVCACANLNAPGQIVIAGSSAAVDRACAIASAKGAKRAMKLQVSVPAHCALMSPAAETFAARLAEVKFETPRITVLHNVDVASHGEAAAMRDALIRQLYSPVRWIETIEQFARAGVTHVAECGPGKVLAPLIKRIDKNLQTVALNEPAGLRDFIALARNELV
ncbi:MAG: ACP S-malonyltransferase [Proteobacteria bacterium]|nr:ACP S-malonyltransferase [Pseudomonadota bacterium]